MNTKTIQTLLKKYADAGGKIAEAEGPLTLYGLFEREDTPGKFDLVVSAPWLSTGRQSLLHLATYLPHLTAEEGALMGGIVALAPDDAFVQTMNRVVRTMGHVIETGPMQSEGVDIIRSFVIASEKRRPRRVRFERRLPSSKHPATA